MTQGMGFVRATNMALDDAMSADESVFLLGEDIADEQGGGVFRVTAGLSTKHGTDRVRSTPIAEQAIVGAAVGAAVAGLRPVAEIMLMNFLAVCMDQVSNHAAKLRFTTGGQTPVPLTILTASGPGVGFGAQHSDLLEAWLAHTPGLKVVMPSTPALAYALLRSCIADDDPCVFIENTLLYSGRFKGPAPEPGLAMPLGRANVERRGEDVTVIGYGRTMLDIRAAAESLSAEGISVEVVDLCTVNPLDDATILESVAKTKRAVVAHDAVSAFGVGAELSSRIHENLFGELAAPVQRVGAEYCPVPFSRALEKAYMVSQGSIEDAVRAALK